LSERAWNANAEELTALADTVRRAHARVHETFAARDQSPEAWAAWQDAAADFHKTLAVMYGSSTFDERIADIRKGDPTSVGKAITFLEVDPWCFGAGYVKERLISSLKGVDLDPRQVDRLTMAFGRVAMDNRGRRELRDWCRLASSQLDLSSLRRVFGELATSPEPRLRLKGEWLLRELPEREA
jgi:hypothetical protein